MILTVVDFPEPLAPEIANNLAGVHSKTNVRDRRYTTIAFGNVVELKHVTDPRSLYPM